MERQLESYSIEQEIRNKVVRIFVEKCPINHPDLFSVTLGGSTSEGSSGIRSDIDVTTILKPKNPEKVDLNALISIGQQIKNSLEDLKIPGIIQPIVISTIRLEEAQIAMSELAGTTALPIHWLHYPSLEFAKVNEPPELIRGLLLNGKTLFGNSVDTITRFEKIDSKEFGHLSGLDWLTDSFKILIANASTENSDKDLQPRNFLFGHATHNLEYFWKWRIIGSMIERESGSQIKGWKDAEERKGVLNKEIWDASQLVRKIRQESPRILFKDIIDLHKITFDLWPDFNKL